MGQAHESKIPGHSRNACCEGYLAYRALVVLISSTTELFQLTNSNSESYQDRNNYKISLNLLTQS